jgi:hypothetical protein
MSKQLLIYTSAVPITSARHKTSSVEAVPGYAFSAGINAVPLMAVEFLRAATEYAIVFTLAGEEVAPAVVLGIKGDQNLYLADDAKWKAKYIPAFIRRYPFVFSTGGDGKMLTLCIDESYPGINTEGRGQRLFGEDGKPAPYVDSVLKFLQEYQAQYERTRIFCKRIKELGLLEPMQAQVVTPQGGKLTLSGFLGVNRNKLRALEGEALTKLVQTDELELLYLHLYSLRNFDDVKDRLFGTLSTDAPAAAEPAPAGAAS